MFKICSLLVVESSAFVVKVNASILLCNGPEYDVFSAMPLSAEEIEKHYNAAYVYYSLTTQNQVLKT